MFKLIVHLAVYNCW